MTEVGKKKNEKRKAGNYLERLEARNLEQIEKKGYRAAYDLARKSGLIILAEAVIIVLWLLMQTMNGPLNTLPLEAFIVPIMVGAMILFEGFNLAACLKLAKKLRENEDHIQR